ncbi:MAG: hypothetical protein VYC34_01085, partial [Planctomycetota bacterium]|nr:hypothetical protein [Planctomycetota bacterium]
MAFPIRFILCAALCIGLLSVLAPASAGRPFIAERVPADVDFLLVIDDAASLRKTPAGDSISSILDVVFFEGRARKRWSDLAIQLGWSEAEAFDRLLGSRIAIVGRGIVPQWGDAQLRDAADQRTAAWAVILEVSADTEQRVRERLKVAPRGIQKGRTIYAVEGGRFELAADRRKHGPSTLLLAPRNASALFDELLPRLGDAALDSFAAS